MIMQALSVSAHLPKETGILNCVGRFNHALNFVTPSGELLTLHRYGRGLSPMGWMVSDTDFQAIFNDENEFVEYKNDRLVSLTGNSLRQKNTYRSSWCHKNSLMERLQRYGIS